MEQLAEILVANSEIRFSQNISFASYIVLSFFSLGICSVFPPIIALQHLLRQMLRNRFHLSEICLVASVENLVHCLFLSLVQDS